MLTWIKKRITRYFNVGIKASNDPEKNRQIFVINLFGAVGFSITFCLGINALIKANLALGVSLLAASALFYTTHLFLRITRIKNGHRYSANLLLSCLMVLMIYLVYSGGASNTGPMWIYLVPPVAMFFGGMKKGIRDILLFVAIISVMLFYPGDVLLATSYTWEFKSRLILSFLTVTFLSAFYEYSRYQSYRFIQELNDKAEKLARQDPLTELTNRRGMREHLTYEFNRTSRGKTPMAVVLCDIDHFKKINDDFGHDAGDEVLKQVAELFLSTLRKQDIVARWGGEEFLFLLPETNINDAFILAEKVRHRLEDATFDHDGKDIRCTLSLGLSEVTQESGIDGAISQADHCLYQAKGDGRNCTRPLANKL